MVTFFNSAATFEEAIRTLVYTREVLSLRDTTTNYEHTASIQRALNRSVIAYGVKITNIRITKAIAVMVPV